MTAKPRSSPDPAPGAEGSAHGPPSAPDWALEHLEVLKALRDMAMEQARCVTRQVVAQNQADMAAEAAIAAGEPPPPPRRPLGFDPGLAFSRISRAVRLTLSMEARLHRIIEAALRGAANDDAPARERGADDDADDDDDDDDIGGAGVGGVIDYEGIGQRLRATIAELTNGMEREVDFDIRRAVEDTIETTREDLTEVERLKDELRRLLYQDEAFEHRGAWPISETIGLICQDLGLTPDWERWRSLGWARDEARDSPHGSPYATRARPPPLPNQHPRPGTEIWRKARGLPLDGGSP